VILIIPVSIFLTSKRRDKKMEIQGLRFNVVGYIETSNEDSGGREGIIVCDISSERKTEFVCWHIGFPHNSDPVMYWGHYFYNAADALADMTARAASQRVFVSA
jgi:hypothetical protein